MLGKLVVVGHIHSEGMSEARRLGFTEVVTVSGSDASETRDALETACAVVLRYVRLEDGLLETAPDLRVVSRHGVGTDNLDLDALSRAGKQVWITGDVNSATVAEHAVMLMLAAARRCVEAHRMVTGGAFGQRDMLNTGELVGKTVLIVGFGQIGRRLERMLSGFDVEILVCDPFSSGLSGVQAVSLHEGLGRADVVTLHAPSTGRPLIDTNALASAKHGQILVNCARGDLVDLDALAAALDSGTLLAAGLDVFPQEPPVPHPVLTDPRVICTPHSAAMTQDCLRRMALVSVQNAARGLRGEIDVRLIVNRDVIQPI
jgi:D-3-phosphoglycerate dehydrogenase